MKDIIYTPDAPEPVGPYSQAIMVGDTLYCSGQIALDNLADDVAMQTEKVCVNVRALIVAAGLQMSDVVKTTCFLTDMDDFAAFNEVYAKYFSHKPARSTIAVSGLPKGALVEIEVIAVQ